MQKCKKGAKLLVLFLVFTLVVGMVPQIPVNAEAGESTLQLYESGQYLPVLLNEDFSDYALGNFIFDGATWRSSNHSTHGTNRNLDPQVVAAPNRTGQALRVVRQSLIMDRLIPNLPTTGILEIQYDIFVPRPVPTSGDLANVGIGLLRDTSPGVGQFASVVWNTYSSSRQNMGPRVPGGGGDPNHPPEQDSNMFNVLPHQGPGGGTPDHYVRNWPTACGRFEAMWRLGDWATLLMVHDLDTGVIRYYLNGEDITPIPGYGNQRTRTITGDGRNFSGVRINSEGPAANGSGAAYITNLVVRGIPREPDATGEIGDTEVARWRNNLVAAFAITADDSSHCHLDYVVPMLDEVGMLGTFFVNPGMGGPGTIGERGHVGNNGFWSFTYRTDEWQAVADRGHELGNHTMHHRGSTDREDAIWQIEETSRILREMQPNATVLPFLAGGGTTWLGVTVAERNQIAWNDNLLTGILVSGAQNPGGTPLTAAETRELDVFYIHGGVWGTGNNRGFTPAQMRGHVQTTINSGGFRWIRLHEVIGPPNPPTTKTVASVDMSVSTYSLQALVDALTVESNRVWVDTVSAIHKYMMTRNNAEITVLNASDTEITIGLTATDREQSVITNNPVVLGPLPQRGTFEELYNESITLLTTVPESWQYAYVTQDGTVQHIRISDGIAMYDAYPNKGDIVLTPSTTSPANYVVSIAVTSQPSNLVYDEGDQVDLSGAAVRLTFANGDTQTVAFEDFEDNGIVARPAHGTELARYHHGGPVTIRHAETNHAAATNNLTVYYEDDGNGNGNGNGAPYEILPITSLEYVFEVEGVTPTDGDNFTLQVVGNTWPYRLPTIPAQNGTQRINIGFGAGINWIINLGRVVRVLNPAFNADGTVNYPLSGPPLSGSTATLTASQIIVNGDIEMTFANTHILRLNADLGQWTDRYFPNVWNTPVAGTVIASTADGTTRLVMQDGIANDSGTGRGIVLQRDTEPEPCPECDEWPCVCEEDPEPCDDCGFWPCECDYVPDGPFSVVRPRQFQKVTEILPIRVVVDPAELGDVASIVANVDGRTFPLATTDGINFTASLNFFELGVTNLQMVEVVIVVTTAAGATYTVTRLVPYILEGIVLSYFSNDPAVAAVQFTDFDTPRFDWEARTGYIDLATHEINGISTTLLEVGFEATHPASHWQQITPRLLVGDNDLTGVIQVSFDIYVPFFSTGGGTTSPDTNAQNSTWQLGGYLELAGSNFTWTRENFAGSLLNNNNFFTTVTGPSVFIRENSSADASTTWRRRSVTVDVAHLDMPNVDTIIFGLVFSTGTGPNRPTFNMPVFIGNIRFYSEPSLPRTQIYNYFDTYLGHDGWFNYVHPTTNATAVLESQNVRFREYSLRLSVDGPGPGSITLNSRASFNGAPLNWSHATDFTNFFFWIQPHNAGDTMNIDITSNGIVYSTVVDLNHVVANAWHVNGWYRVNVPFANFVGTGGNLGTPSNRNRISDITFTIQSGHIYLDHIYAHRNVPDPLNHKTPLDISSFVDKGGEPVDPNITVEAASLFQFLRNVMYDPDVVLFGHQQTTQDGLSFTDVGDFTNSDVKLGVNDYPAVIGYDSLSFYWNLEEAIASAIFAARELGAIITLASHLANPMAPGLPYTNLTPAFGPDGVLVEGTAAHNRMVAHFEMVYQFCRALQDAGVPVIYRPWHEVTRVGGSNFFWWHTATPRQYVELWQWTYYFLTERGIHNVLWAYSPNTDNAANIIALYTYGPDSFFPGDAYVDIFGYDTYTTNFDGPGNNFVSVLNALFIEADARGKILALTETGSNTQGNPPPPNYFMDMLDALMAGVGSRYTAYVLTWANYGPTNFFIPWPEFDNEPEHPRHECFVHFYNDPRTVFTSQIGGFEAITGLRLRGVTGVSIQEYDVTIDTGETVTLTAVVRPVDARNTNVAWTSDNPEIASVCELGVVTGVAPGVATITVTTEDGGLYATVVVTVLGVIQQPVFSWDIFNNGEGGSPSRPNPGLAAAGIIRMWTQLDGVNTPVYLAATDTIEALDQDGECAEDFVRVGRVWQDGTGWLNYFNLLDIDKDGGSWRYINLYITVYGQRVHVLLVNALFEEPVLPVFSFDIFNNGEGGSPSRPNPGLAAAGIIRMWTQLDGVNAPVYLAAADTIEALDQDGECAEDFVRVGRVWQDGTGWLDYFNRIDVDKDGGSWRYINLYITVYGQRVHVLLVNANFTTQPPPEFDCDYCEDAGCEICRPTLPTFYLYVNNVTVSNTNRHVSVFVGGTAEGEIRFNLLEAAPELVIVARDNLWTPTGLVYGLVVGIRGGVTVTESRVVELEVTRQGITEVLTIQVLVD